MKPFITACVLLLVVSGCTRTDQWTLTFRPDPSPAPWAYAEVAGYYGSLAQCEAKGKGLKRLQGDKGQYQCAQNCDKQGELLVCAKVEGNGNTQP